MPAGVMLSFRVDRETAAEIEEGRRARGWSRTIWLRRAAGMQLADDRETFGLVPHERQRQVDKRRAEVARVRSWRDAHPLPPIEDKPCEYCDMVFTPATRSSRLRFCSPACRWAAWYENREASCPSS